MKSTIDYSLYNQIKEKFPAQPETILFISLISNDVNELTSLSFTKGQQHDLDNYVNDHCANNKPYVAVGGYNPKWITFFYITKEFMQREDCKTGKVLEFKQDPFTEYAIYLEAVKKDLSELSKLLFGNSQAS